MPTIRTVLFDLHNTTMDGGYSRAGLAHVGALMADRWGIESTEVAARFVPAVHDALQVYATQDFYLMRDVFVDALGQIADALDVPATEADLVELEAEFWRGGADAIRPTDGAIETFDRLRAAGIPVGIVSWADNAVFDMMIERVGFAGHVDVAVCSEAAQSCKPHPGIFRWALDALDADPTTTMFVGDNVDGDIVGSNRLGMTSVLVQGSEYTDDRGASAGDPDAIPDHVVGSLYEVADLVIGSR